MAAVRRFFRDPLSSYFLFGPRGTGKSTWLREAYPEALWLDLLEPEGSCARSIRSWPRSSASGSIWEPP
jgi:hypothetical protein